MNRLALRIRNLVFFVSLLLGLNVSLVQADPGCETYWDPVSQSFITICSGGGGTGGGGGGGSGGGGGTGGGCLPGTIVVVTVVTGGSALCEVWEVWQDACTGQVVFANLVNIIAGGSCTPPTPGSGGNASNPCIVISVNAGGVYCRTDWGLDWLLEAEVGFPSAFLDLRPYPATLIRWPSAARNGGTPQASGSGTLDYIAYGGGDEDEPELGDWRQVKLTLRLVPAAPILFFSMPTIGTLPLLDVGPLGAPTALFFEKPSHPEAGAQTLAGQVGLNELPPDLPVFSGSAQSAYRLFWTLRYEKWDRDCVPGPEPLTGAFQCRTIPQALADDGHWEYGWDPHGMGGEITPQMVVGLPAGMAADLDGDGSPDAYWNRKVTVRRMDNANRIDNAAWSGSWNWGGAVYWAVREGQGQIEWPR